MSQQFEFPKRPPAPPVNFSPRMAFTVIGALLVLWGLSGIYTVEPDEKAVVLRFGKVQDVVDQGCIIRLQLRSHSFGPLRKYTEMKSGFEQSTRSPARTANGLRISNAYGG